MTESRDAELTRIVCSLLVKVEELERRVEKLEKEAARFVDDVTQTPVPVFYASWTGAPVQDKSWTDASVQDKEV